VIAAPADRDNSGVAPTPVRKQKKNMVLYFCISKLKNGQMIMFCKKFLHKREGKEPKKVKMKELQNASFCHAMRQIASRLRISHVFSLKNHDKLRIFGPNIGNIEY